MNLIALLFLFLLMFALKHPVLQLFSLPEQSTSLALGFILIFAFLCGRQINRLKLPRITGFLLAGILCGPYIFKFLTLTDVRHLQLLDGLALSLIALTAGGEMRLARIKKNFKLIASIAVFQTLIIIVGFVLLGFMGRAFFPYLPDGVPALLSFSLLLATLAAATSPSTTIAVMTEIRSQGKYTDLILSSAVVKDFFVIALFAFSLSLAKATLSVETEFNAGFLLPMMREIGGSILFGALIGLGIILYLKYIKKELAVFILGIAFLTYQVSHHEGYHPLMICLIAGFIVQNLSSLGEELIQALEKVSMPVYVVFFAISGASLDLNALRSSWLLALIYVIWRGVLKFFGTYVGARLVRAEPGVRKHSWAGFISQARVALGMAVVIERTFPVWGGEFKALILAVIAVNQIIGPILLQKLLIKTGEAGRKKDR